MFRCLTITGSSEDHGNTSQLSGHDTDLKPHTFQQWRVIVALSVWYGNYYEIQNVGSGYCITPAGGRGDAGAPMVQHACDKDSSREWALGPVLGEYWG